LYSFPAQAALPVTNALACWYDASLGVTGDGSGVTAWADQSGNGHTATRASGTATLALNQINSLPAVQLRGGGTWFNCAGGMFTKEQYLVVRSPNTNWNGSGSFLGRASPDFLTVRASSYNFYSGYTGFWDDQLPSAVSKNGTVVSSSKGTMDRGGFELVTITNYMILKIIVNANADAANLAAYPYYNIGKNETLGTMDFDVAEIIGYTNTLSSADEKQIGAYLVAKYHIAAAYPPLPPVGLTASIPTTGVIGLNWTDAFGATGYRVKRSTASGAETFLATTSTTNFNDSAIVMGTRYYYVVTATNNYGESANSLEVSDIAPPPGMFIVLR